MEGTTPTTTTTSAAPANTPSTPVSTGTTTAPATPTPAERPTFAQAFAQDAAPQTTDPATQPEGATTPPVDGADPQSATSLSTEAKGPIPFEVHHKALENRGVKAVEEFRKTAGVDLAVAHAQKIQANAPGFLGEFARELLANPQHAGAARAELARIFGGLRQTAQAQQAASEPKPAPDVQIVDAQGNVTGMTYSADQLEKRDAWVQRQQATAQQKAETAKRDAVAKEQVAEKVRNQRADEQMAEVADMLGLSESASKEQRYDLFQKLSLLMQQNPRMSAHRAALEVKRLHVDPANAGKAEADVLKTLQTKAAANTVNPAGAVVAAAARPRSFLDKSLKW